MFWASCGVLSAVFWSHTHKDEDRLTGKGKTSSWENQSRRGSAWLFVLSAYGFSALLDRAAWEIMSHVRSMSRSRFRFVQETLLSIKLRVRLVALSQLGSLMSVVIPLFVSSTDQLFTPLHTKSRFSRLGEREWHLNLPSWYRLYPRLRELSPISSIRRHEHIRFMPYLRYFLHWRLFLWRFGCMQRWSCRKEGLGTIVRHYSLSPLCRIGTDQYFPDVCLASMVNYSIKSLNLAPNSMNREE